MKGFILALGILAVSSPVYAAQQFDVVSDKKGHVTNVYWNGKKIRNFENGKIREITYYKNGYPHGSSIKYYHNGFLSSKSTYKNGELHGEHTAYYRTIKAIKRKVTYKNGEEEGFEYSYNSTYNGKTYLRSKVHYVKGIISGKSTYYRRGGNLESVGYYAVSKIGRSERHGVKIYYRDNKMRQKSYYKFGEKHGLNQEFNGDGTIKSQDYFQDGKYVKKLSVCGAKAVVASKVPVKDNYAGTDGIKKVVLRYRSGKVRKITFYKHDDKHGLSTSFNYLGQKTSSVEYKKGEAHGKMTRYYNSGDTKQIITFNKGIQTGPYSMFWPNGKLREKGHYIKTRKHGVIKSYTSEGTLVSVENYSHNYRKGVQKYYQNKILRKEQFFESNGRSVVPKMTKYKQWDKAGKLIKHNKVFPDGSSKSLL